MLYHLITENLAQNSEFFRNYCEHAIGLEFVTNSIEDAQDNQRINKRKLMRINSIIPVESPDCEYGGKRAPKPMRRSECPESTLRQLLNSERSLSIHRAELVDVMPKKDLRKTANMKTLSTDKRNSVVVACRTKTASTN